MTTHKDLTGPEAIHPAAFVGSSDPGAVGADKFWVDTTTGPPYTLKKRDAGDSAWEQVGASGNPMLSALADVVITGISVNDILQWDGSNWVNVPNTGGGGGGGITADHGQTAQTLEYHFEDAILDPDWTVLTTPSGGNVGDPNYLNTLFACICPGSVANDAYEAWAPFLPGSGDWSVTAKLVFQGHDQYATAGITVGDTNTNVAPANGYQFFIQYLSGTVHLKCSLFVGSSNLGDFVDISGIASGLMPKYVHIQRVGTRTSFYYSVDGFSWVYANATTSSLTSFNPAYMFVYAGGYGASFGSHCGVDWIRTNWLFLPGN